MERELHKILRHYSLGEPTDVRRAQQGFVNDNWILETTQGRYFLKRRHPRLRRPSLIRAQHDLIEWLRQRGFPAPTIVPTGTGATFVILDGELYDIQAYIEGQPYDHHRPAHLEEAALTLARYHTLVQGFASKPLCSLGELYSPGILSTILTVLTQAWGLEQHPSLAEMRKPLEGHLDQLWGQFAGHGKLPRLVIHGDYYADNLLFASDRIVGVVDYDKARWQPRVVEVAEALIYFASPRPGDFKHLVYPGVLNWEPLVHFLQSYASGSALEKHEILALPDYIRCIWLSVSLKRLLEKGPRRIEAPEALREVLILGDWAKSNSHQMIEACRSAMAA